MTDDELAEFLLREEQYSEAERAFLSHLIASLRKGHLCVLAGDQLYPPSDREALILEGAKKIPKSLKAVRREGSLFWLERIYKEEALFKEHLLRLKSAAPEKEFDSEKLKEVVGKKLAQGLLLKEQGDAIVTSLSNSLSLLVGGPGTGKTYTVGHLIETALTLLPEEERSQFVILLAAPTGKAAHQLKRSLSGKSASSIESKTLHSLLGLSQKNPKGRDSALIVDLLIIDEASMIDLTLMAKLFSLIPTGARVILLGDPHQLPPVEAGSLFTDLVKGAEGVPKSELKSCMRSEMGGILKAGEATLRGDSKELLAALDKGPGTSFQLIEGETVPEIQQQLVAFFKPHFPRFLLKEPPTVEEVRSLTTLAALLLPTKSGPLGVDAMNERLIDALLKRFRPAATPLMVLKNVRDLGLFNGDMGLLFGDYGYFLVGEEGRLFKCPKQLLPEHQVGFSLTIHKSQGSEFQHVALCMPQPIDSFGRELFYTGITRARLELKLFATELAIETSLQKVEARLSSLSR